MGKTLFKSLFLLSILLVVPNFASATVNFTNGMWSTTFNYGPCSQRGGGGQTDCDSVKNDGIQWAWGAASVGGNYTQSTSAANNPVGGGGLGMRMWMSDGSNIETGPIQVTFPSAQKQIWVRWYERWENGFKWSPLSYKKSLYIRTGGASNPYAGFVGSNEYRIYNQSSVGSYPVGTGGWNTVYPGGVSNGTWHCYEVYMKMDTNNADGIGKIWVDGNLVASMTNVNWSNGNASARNGFTWFDFQNNQASPGNGKAMYVDTDDMVIYNTTPPNRDASGNAYIGPIGGSTGGGGGGATDTTAPTISNPQPASTLPTGTVSTTMRVTTNENATCKYGTSNVAYASLPSTFSTTGATTHSTSLTGLTNGSSATYYIRCTDSSGNASTASTPITVAVSNTQPSTPPSANIIFQDNYDTAGDTGWNCSKGLRSGYTGQSTCPSPTAVGGVTHYSGEIATGGRTGNSLKLWRRNGGTTQYEGYLDKNLTSSEFNSHHKELYVRWYVKIPPAWDASLGSGQTHKLNRFYYGTSAGDHTNEMYFDVKGGSFKTGKISIYPSKGLGWAWRSQLTVSQLGLNDGNWHSIETRFKIDPSVGGFQVWVDGTAVNICDGSGNNCGTNHTNINTGGASDYFTSVLPPAIGNLTDGSWNFPTSGWYAFEFDDYAVSTSYIGPTSGGGGGTTPPPPSGGDTIPPAVPTGVTVS